MKRIAGHSFFVTSMVVVMISSWAWWRSYRIADHIYRAEPARNLADEEVTLARGIASFKGALVIGKVEEAAGGCTSVRYCHNTYPLLKSTGSSMIQVRPAFLLKSLGFGISTGVLGFELPAPIAFVKSFGFGLISNRNGNPGEDHFLEKHYRAVYIPYYFFILLGLVVPLMRVRRYVRAVWRV